MSIPSPKPAWRSTKAQSPKKSKRTPPPPTGLSSPKWDEPSDVPFNEVSFFGSVSLGQNVHLRAVVSLPKHDLVWVGNDRGLLTGHNNKSGRKVLSASLPAKCGPINCLVGVEDAIWGGCGSGELIVVDGRSGSVVRTLADGHRKSILSAIYDESCAAVVTGGVDHSISIWSTKKMSLVTTIDCGQGAITSLASLPADLFPDVAFASGDDKTVITLWDNNNDAAGSLSGHEGVVLCLQVVPESRDRARLWSGGADGLVLVWDIDAQRCIKTLQRHEGAVTSLMFNEGETRVWSCGTDGLVVSWDIFSLEPLCTLTQQDAAVCAVPISRASVWKVWICGEDGTAQCYLSQAAENEQSSHSHLQSYAEDCMIQIEQQHDEIKRLHDLLREETNTVAKLKAAAVDAGPTPQMNPPKATPPTQDQPILSVLRNQLDLSFLELEETESFGRECIRSCCNNDCWKFTEEILQSMNRMQLELDATANERDHFQQLVVEHTSRAPSPAPIEEANTRIQELEDSLRVCEKERSAAIRELHQCQSEMLELRHSSAEVTKAQLEDFRRQNDSLRESMRNERQDFGAEREKWVQQIDALTLEQQRVQETFDASKATQASQLHEIKTLKDALQLAQAAITTAKADVGKTQTLERELETQRQRSTELHNALSAMELDAQEMRLSVDQQREAHERETQKLKADLMSMRAPWETMKRALAESRGALESAKTQFVSDLSSLEQQIEAKDREIAVLKRSLAANHSSHANGRQTPILDRLSQHVRRV